MRSSGKKQSRKVTCYRCGGNHIAPNCKHKNAKCYRCKGEGHLANRCKTKRDGATGGAKQSKPEVKYVTDKDSDSLGIYKMLSVGAKLQSN